MKSTGITTKNFGRKLSGVVKSAKTMRGNLQNILLFSMEHWYAHGDTGPLDRCMEACVGVQALPTQKMKQFIQEHASVTWREVEIKSGANKGKKINVFKQRGKDRVYQEPTCNWWEFSKAGDAVPDMDTDASIINLHKRIQKKLTEKHVKDTDHARKALKGLEKLASDLGIAITA